MSAAPNAAGPQLVTTKSRGTIVKVPDASPGLLMVNNSQKQFTLEDIWKSPVAPAPNMTVEVELDAAGMVKAITAVDSRQLAKEQFDKLSGKVGEFAQTQAKEGSILAKEYLKKLAARMGTAMLISVVVLWIAWFFLPGYKVDLLFRSNTYTLWEFFGLSLGQFGTAEISHGFWSMLGVISILAPFMAPFIKDGRARFANVLPLLFTLIAIYAQRSNLIKALGLTGNDAGSVLSMQLGAYLAIIASVVVAGAALKAPRV
jgi:hypothetical protein